MEHRGGANLGVSGIFSSLLLIDAATWAPITPSPCKLIAISQMWLGREDIEFADQKILDSDLFRLFRLDLDRFTGRGSLVLGAGVVIASTGMATVGTLPYINNAVSTWNALQVQADRDSLITRTYHNKEYNYLNSRGANVCPSKGYFEIKMDEWWFPLEAHLDGFWGNSTATAIWIVLKGPRYIQEHPVGELNHFCRDTMPSLARGLFFTPRLASRVSTSIPMPLIV